MANKPPFPPAKKTPGKKAPPFGKKGKMPAGC